MDYIPTLEEYEVPIEEIDLMEF
ncbi:hypothetical protein CCYN49044_480002 [Capnocytophaga cynodegmi]|nr:hypothetical protein CCYN49044_480002 [Capnocytophaga cynodegmi]